MVSIEWCLEKRRGLRLVEPSEAMSESYLEMAEESIRALQKVEESRIWRATTAYYVFYYALYSLMLRIGVKCEIHSCSIEFMKRYLREFYSGKDMSMFEKAFSARINLQYYADRTVDDAVIDDVDQHCRRFFVKTKDSLAGLGEAGIREIRKELEDRP